MRKYLLYAIGEIILVVIGILIALQINNWNSIQLQHKAEHKALKDLRQEFTSNYEEFKEIIAYKSTIRDNNKAFIEEMKNGFDKADQLIQKRIGVGEGGIWTFNQVNDVLSTLLNTGKIDFVSNDTLKYNLIGWNELIEDYKEGENRHLQFREQVWEPYEMTLIPRPYYNNQRPEWLFQDRNDVKRLFIKAFQDMRYQNYILKNEAYLTGTIESSLRVKQTFEKIIRQLDTELNKR